MTKIFLDTEFTGLHQQTTLISLALVAETGEEFYAELIDYDKDQLNDWLVDNVIAKLVISNKKAFDKKENGVYIAGDRASVRAELGKWFTRFEGVEIWADVLAYDWVLFCELFGGALQIPGNIFYAPFDLATLFYLKGHTEPQSKYEKDVSRYKFVGNAETRRHFALEDARVELKCWKKIMTE